MARANSISLTWVPLAPYFLISTLTASLGLAPTDSQYSSRALSSVTRASVSGTEVSYVPSSSITRPSRGLRLSVAQIR